MHFAYAKELGSRSYLEYFAPPKIHAVYLYQHHLTSTYIDETHALRILLCLVFSFLDDVRKHYTVVLTPRRISALSASINKVTTISAPIVTTSPA